MDEHTDNCSVMIEKGVKHMRKITRITTQVKNKNRYNIFLNSSDGEEFAFSVDEAILVEYRLRKGLELTDSLITELVEKDTVHKSYTQAIHFLSFRMRSKKEIHDYLIKKEVDMEHIKQIIQRLTDEKLLNDQQFANMFVQSRMNTTSKGPNLIKKELLEKGVSAIHAEVALENYPFDVQLEKINKLILKKLNSTKKDSFQKQVQKLQTNLIQKGFTQNAIQTAFMNIQEEKSDDSEWEALVYQGEKLIRKHESKHEGYALRKKVTEGLYRKGFPFELINKFLDERSGS